MKGGKSGGRKYKRMDVGRIIVVLHTFTAFRKLVPSGRKATGNWGLGVGLFGAELS